jgi:hypothetical protein
MSSQQTEANGSSQKVVEVRDVTVRINNLIVLDKVSVDQTEEARPPS